MAITLLLSVSSDKCILKRQNIFFKKIKLFINLSSFLVLGSCALIPSQKILSESYDYGVVDMKSTTVLWYKKFQLLLIPVIFTVKNFLS